MTQPQNSAPEEANREAIIDELFTPQRRDPSVPLPFPFRTHVAHSAERHTVFAAFSGGIGIVDAAAFKASLHDLVTAETAKVMLDFSAATLSRSTLGALIDFAAAMHGNNKRLYLYHPSTQVRHEMKKVGLSAFFSFLESEDDLIASLAV